MPFGRLYPEFLSSEFHHEVTGNSNQNTVIRCWSCQFTVFIQEYVLSASFGYISIRSKHYRLIIPMIYRFCLCQGVGDIETGQFSAWYFSGKAPRGYAALYLFRQIRSPGEGEHKEIILKVMKADTEGFRTLVCHRPDIDILLESTFINEFYGNVAHLFNRVGHVYLQYAATVQKAFIMSFQGEYIILLFFGIPVTPDTLKNAGAVVDEICNHSQLCLRQGYEFILYKCV